MQQAGLTDIKNKVSLLKKDKRIKRIWF